MERCPPFKEIYMGKRAATYHDNVKKIHTGFVERRQDFTVRVAHKCQNQKLGIDGICSAFETD